MSGQANYRITFPEAVKYVQDYIDHFELNDVARQNDAMNAIGGTLKIAEIKNQIKEIKRQKELEAENNTGTRSALISYQGLMCWMCYLPTQGTIKEHFFLAFEAHDKVDLASEDQEQDNQILSRPFDVIVYDKDLHSNVSDWLKTPRLMVSQFRDLITRKDVDQTVKAFKTKIKDIEATNEKKPYGLFENTLSQDVTDFLDTPGLEYIRYYFGYNKNKTENRIRLILFGVDREGNNLIPPQFGNQELLMTSGAVLNDSTIIENSWPPQ